MLNIPFFFSFFWLIYGAPEQMVPPGIVPAQKVIVQDSTALLTNEWVLRERLREKEGKLQPITPLEPLRLVLYPDQTYKLIRQHHAVNAISNSIETVEWGNWEVNKDRGLISVQVTNVDGRSIMSAVLYRWQIEKLTPQQLILNQFEVGNQLLVFEPAK